MFESNVYNWEHWLPYNKGSWVCIYSKILVIVHLVKNYSWSALPFKWDSTRVVIRSGDPKYIPSVLNTLAEVWYVHLVSPLNALSHFCQGVCGSLKLLGWHRIGSYGRGLGVYLGHAPVPLVSIWFDQLFSSSTVYNELYIFLIGYIFFEITNKFRLFLRSFMIEISSVFRILNLEFHG